MSEPKTASNTPVVLSVHDLVVDYGRGARKTRAVDGMAFEVREGECVGFVGPNGAGKSTTIKAIMGFLFPTSGTVTVFGEAAGTVASRERIGYLPEVALYYPFMKARELLELYGGLHKMGRASLATRIPELLAEVGLGGKEEVLLRNFSKGMQQRLGIAQAIISDPELLIFDELSSGLDPIGRYDLRQVLLKLKAKGRTIFFSSHELTEVEDLCDRVLIVHKGRCIEEKEIGELLHPLNRFTIRFSLPSGRAPEDLAETTAFTQEGDSRFRCEIVGAEEYATILKNLTTAGATIHEARSEQVSLEKYFMNLIQSRDGATGHIAAHSES
ncbi:MAG: ABC transporter ATP-binding protein [Candidatus Omnitrophica bacterium]|nr:Vitamin B12 import ATP-binding protein BtuD [bacterium]NUN94723.1 ABC transporter ATP-binding protein [Candidatus Omnitrophota bacterium]